jgi:hypothetical protein
MQVPKTENAAIWIWGTLTGLDHILAPWRSVLFFGKELHRDGMRTDVLQHRPGDGDVEVGRGGGELVKRLFQLAEEIGSLMIFFVLLSLFLFRSLQRERRPSTFHLSQFSRLNRNHSVN